jgi:hypothetical protein
MRNPLGYATIVDPDRPLVERDTITCGHCQQIVFTKPSTASTVYLILESVQPEVWREEAGAFCRICMRPICLACHDHGRCTPWERLVEAAEARDRRRRSFFQ